MFNERKNDSAKILKNLAILIIIYDDELQKSILPYLNFHCCIFNFYKKICMFTKDKRFC